MNLHKYFKHSFVRFLMVGLSNTAISYIAYLVSFYLAVPLIANLDNVRAGFSQVLSYSAGIIWSYHLNKRFTFNHQGGSDNQLFIRFCIAQIAMLIASSAFISILVDQLHWEANISWFLVMGVVTVANYIVARFWVFK